MAIAPRSATKPGGGVVAAFGRGKRFTAAFMGGLVMCATAVVGVAAPAGAVTCASGPTAIDHTYTTTYGKALKLVAPGLLQGATGNTVTIDIADSDPQSFYNGSLAYGAAGSLTYQPAAGFAGEDTFTYWVQDACGNTSFGFVTIEVLPILAVHKYSTAMNTTLNVSAAAGLMHGDLGVDPSGPADFQSVSKYGGAVDVNESDGSFTYTPAHNFKGTDTFTYSIWDMDLDNYYTSPVTITVGSAPASPPPPGAVPSGYWMVEQQGTVHAFGQVKNYGNASSANVTHFEPTPTHKGYWIVSASGHVFAFGDAKSYGNATGLAPGEIVSSISSTPTGRGYWIFTSIGRAIRFGDAQFYGDMSHVKLDGPVVGSIATPSGHGYYMVASDGGIFTFGDAKFRGSMGGKHLDKPVEGLVPTQNNLGYWLVASDGGIFAFGNAPFRGSMGGQHLNRPIVGMVRYGNGYLMVGSDGGIFDFSNQPFLGSLGGNPPPDPIVGVAA